MAADCKLLASTRVVVCAYSALLRTSVSSSSFSSPIINFPSSLASLFSASAASILLNSKARSADTALPGAAGRFPFALSRFDGAASFEFLSGNGRGLLVGGSGSLLSVGALSCEEAVCCSCCWRARRAATALTAERGAAFNPSAKSVQTSD